MNINKEQKDRLEAKKHEWAASGSRHNGLMRLAWAYKREGVPLNEAIADAQALYSSIEEPGKHDEHIREVEQAFNKAYECEYTVSRPTPKIDTGASYKDEQREWLNLQGSDETELEKAILGQNTSEKRTTTRAALKSLFRHTSGRIRFGQTVNTIRWAETENDFLEMCSNSLQCVYMTTTTFGDLLDEERQKELEGKGAKYTAYSAKDDNVREKACILLEYDEPMGEDRISKDAFSYLSDEEKNAYRGKILSHTCKILERAGLKPTTVTFSGNRSYHCLFRLAKPVTKEEWGKYEEKLKAVYMRIGADEATLSFNRMTRVPRGCPKAEAEQGESQHIMYFDDGAETTLEEFVERLEKIADEISQVKEKAGKITLAMEKTVGPKTGNGKWEFNPSKWEKSLEDMGIKVKYKKLDNLGNYEIALFHDGGLYHVVSAQGALDYIVRMYKAQDFMAGAMFREKRASKLTSEKYEQYAGLAEAYRNPADTRARALVPYRNGLLEITAKGLVFHADTYNGLDIPDDEPTLTRDWRLSLEMGELEDFIELACGRADGDRDWKARKEAIMSLLGYEICGAKEAVNYFPVIVEKSMEAHNGGTGKSLITKALSFMRKTCFLDFKTWDDDQRFFFADLAKTIPKIARCEDLPKSFDLEKLFNRLTEGFKADIKGKDSVTLDMNTMPKFIATSNSYLKGIGNSYKRRYREYEITDYWREKNPERHYGHLLYFDWNDEEWSRFDSFMAVCVLRYLKDGLKQFEGVNSVEKSLDANLGDLRDFFDETLDPLPYWTTASELIEKYETWYKTVHAGKYMKVSYTSKTIKAKLKTYCALKGLVYDDNDGAVRRRRDGESKRWIQVAHAGAVETAAGEVQNAGTDKDPFLDDVVEPQDAQGAQATETECFSFGGRKAGFTFLGGGGENGLELECRVTSKNGSEKKAKVTIPERRIKTHRTDRDGNIILED